MEALRRAWADAAAGAGGVVLLAREAGVGKTRLAAELAGDVEAAGGCVLVGVCPRHGAEPYQPLVEALGPLPAGERDRDSMLATLAAGVAARARRAPVLLVLDDLHHADRSTLLALQKVAEAGAGVPLLIVATYRDRAVDRAHPLTEFLAAVRSGGAGPKIEVEGLSPEDLGAWVGDADLGRRLWRRSAGNPVWVAELLRPGAMDGVVPVAFDELVARRVARLTPAARAFLHAAAVCGREFRVVVAAVAAGGSASRVPVALKEVVAAGFVVEEPPGPGGTRRFADEMVREAVERAISPGAAVQLHRSVGLALEAGEAGQPPAPAALVAWHLRRAAPVGGSKRALRHSARAGDAAMAALAWDEAAVEYGHALAAGTGAGAAVRADLLLLVGEAQRVAGESARARQAFLEAAGMARSCADGPRMARAALALGQVDAVWGADPELEAVAGEARALLGRASLSAPPPVPTHVAANASPPAAPRSLPAASYFASESLYDELDGIEPVEEPPAAAPSPAQRSLPAASYFASESLYDELDGVGSTEAPAPTPPAALAAVRPVRDVSEAAALLRARHLALAGPEHVTERLEAADQTVALAVEADDDELAVAGHGWRLVDLLTMGRVDQVIPAQAAHAEVARRLGRPGPASDAAAWRAMRALLDGRPDDARSAAGDAYDLAVDAGDPEADASYLMQRWWLALEWGTHEELAQVAEECRARATTGAGGRAWRAALALARARGGHLELAAEELRRVTDHGLGELIRDPGRLAPLACLVEVAWIVGDGYRAATVGELLEPFADQVLVAGRGLVCQGSVARASALAAAAAGRWDDAERRFRSALAVHRSMGALPLLARTRFEYSTMLAERGRMTDRRRANESRRHAVELTTGLGMSRLREEIAHRAA